MNTQRRLKAMKEARLWGRKVEIASDEYPGTDFDKIIEDMIDGLRWAGENRAWHIPSQDGNTDSRPMGEFVLMQWGHTFAHAIKRGDSKFFHELANAIDVSRNHVPQPDRLRCDILSVCSPDHPTSIRYLLQRLEMRGHRVGTGTRRANFQRNVREICRQLKIKISGTSGRTRKDGSVPQRRTKTRMARRPAKR